MVLTFIAGDSSATSIAAISSVPESRATDASSVGASVATPPDFKVAFIGDQGVTTGAAAVLQMIKDEGTQMVLHQGDLGYGAGPDAWEQQLDDILGPDFPYFASIGNHELDVAGQWSSYQQKLQARVDRIAGATCTGDLGVNSACTFQGLFFVLSGVGTLGTGHVDFITDALASDSSVWRFCSWHKNQRLMQIASKTNEVGWAAYEACRLGGAIIATGHDHSYARTHLMASLETQTIASTSNTLQVEDGKTFAFVSGLGGISHSIQDSARAASPWWAAVYGSPQGANYGALFCAFNESGVINQAHCYFKDIDGVIADEFDIVAAGVPVPIPTPVPGVSQWGLVVIALALAGLMHFALRQRPVGEP